MSSITQRNADAFSVGVALDGAGWHPAAWRERAVHPEELLAADYWLRLIAAAEQAGLDYATIEDSLAIPSATGRTERAEHEVPRPRADRVDARLDALMIASWVAARTSKIGIIPTVTTTHTEPFHLSTGLQTLDHISEGRAGWQLRVSPGAAEARAFGRRSAPEIDAAAVSRGEADAGFEELLAEAHDVAEVARRLWDSWESDAIIRDVATGRFLDRDKVHRISFTGDHFSVIGPSIVPRSPQGQLPITLLAHTPAVLALAAHVADAVFVTPSAATPSPLTAAPAASSHDTVSLPGNAAALSAADTVARVRTVETRAGRNAELPLRIIADLVVVLDTPGEQGSDRLERLTANAGEPLASDASVIAGSASAVADVIAEWRAAGIDGVRLRPAVLPTDLDAITTDLLPELRLRGIVAELAAPAESSLDVDTASSQTRLRRALGLRDVDTRSTRTEAA